ncbi:MAG: hypothetical protein QOI66_4983 [Myxococcales bacterium]|jgi:hypothetical protein|nr:hypothetical protein [Myxococcales bacterium]
MANAFLVMAGALCALGGYFVGAWRQRLAFRFELDGEDMDSHERVLEMIESLAEGGAGDLGDSRDARAKDNRPN